jgi:RNA polymerase primary sigma factor
MRRVVDRSMIEHIPHPPTEPPCRARRVDIVNDVALIRAARTGDAAARAELLEAVAPLIASLARHHGATRDADPELVQAGAVGVLRALEHYDPELGTPFWAYASWWVRQAIQDPGAPAVDTK